MTLLEKLNDDGRTIIVITHDESLAKRAKRIVRIDDGRLSELRDVFPDSDVNSGKIEVGDVA